MFKSSEQAKKEILEAKNEKADRDRVIVSDAIEKMIKDEEKSFVLYDQIMPSVKRELEEAGYSVESSSFRNEYNITVSIKE